MNVKGILTAIGLTLIGLTAANATTLDDAGKSTYPLGDGRSEFCSTTIVDEDKALTAYHCIDGGDTFSITKKTLGVKPKKGAFPVERTETVYLKVLRSFKDNDTALLATVDGKPFPESFGEPVEIATEKEVNDGLKLGTPLSVLGYPKIQELTLTQGMFTAKAALDGFGDGSALFYKTTVPTTGGGSGGGLYMHFGDKVKLIGTTSAGYRDVSFMTYYSSIESVQKTITGLLDKPKVEEKDTDSNKNPTNKMDDR